MGMPGAPMPGAPMPGVPGPMAGPIQQPMMPQQPAFSPQPVLPQQQPQGWAQGPPVNDPPVQTVIRGVSAEASQPEPPPRVLEPVHVPTPEQLGVAAPQSHDPSLDWSGIRARLHELGAVGFHLDTLTDGSCRFTCQLATAEFGQTQCIEARASTEAEAVGQALGRAAQYRRRN